MRVRHGTIVLVVAAVLAGATACGSPAEPGTSQPVSVSSEPVAPGSAATTSGTGSSAAAEEAVITIADFQYVMPETIAPGAEVTVVNEDDAPHTVTAKDEGGFDVDVPGGETVTFTAPGEAGEYAVICTYHPAMSAVLVVG